MPKRAPEPTNQVNINATWRDRVSKEITEAVTASGFSKKNQTINMDFWNRTETQVVFSGHDRKPELDTTTGKTFGYKQKDEKVDTDTLKLPQDYFVPILGHSTTTGDEYGYGPDFKEKSENLAKKLGKSM